MNSSALRIFKILLLFAVLTACKDDNKPPLAQVTSFPLSGDTTILFELDAGKSLDDTGLKNYLSYRWDFNGDSVWDTDYRTESTIGHYFVNPGTHKVVVEVSDFFGLTDTASISVPVMGMNKDTGTFTDPRDRQSYRMVKLRDSWWMAENLRYGVTIDRYTEQTDNGITEMYRWAGPHNGDTIGGTYRWLEAMNYNLDSRQGICPDGWHIPASDEYKELFDGLLQYQAIRYYGPEGLSGLRLDMINGMHMDFSDGEKEFHLWGTGFWASDFKRSEGRILPGTLWFDWVAKWCGIGYQVQSGPENQPTYVAYVSVRCKKD